MIYQPAPDKLPKGVFLPIGLKELRLRHFSAQEIQGEFNPPGIIQKIILFLLAQVLGFLNNWRARKLITGGDSSRKLENILRTMGRDNAYFSCFLEKISCFAHEARVKAGTYSALRLFYRYTLEIKPYLKKNISGFITRFFFERSISRQAVCNRSLILADLIERQINHRLSERTINLTLIGSASIDAVVSVIRRYPARRLKVAVFDLDRSALKEAEELVQEADLTDYFAFRPGYKQAFRQTKQTPPDLIIIGGYEDYLSDENLLILLRQVHSTLKTGGCFIATNIARCYLELTFLSKGMLWPPMVARSAKDLAQIGLAANFSAENLRLFAEPHRLHNIMLGIKA